MNFGGTITYLLIGFFVASFIYIICNRYFFSETEKIPKEILFLLMVIWPLGLFIFTVGVSLWILVKLSDKTKVNKIFIMYSNLLDKLASKK